MTDTEHELVNAAEKLMKYIWLLKTGPEAQTAIQEMRSIIFKAESQEGK